MQKRLAALAAPLLLLTAIIVLTAERGCLTFLGGLLTDPYRDLRCRLRQVGVEHLQQWAVSVLDNPPQPSADEREDEVQIAPQDLPGDIRLMAGRGQVFYVKELPDAGQEQHILFACGGGFYHYGLRVGRPSYRPSPDSQFRYEEFADGVWGMSER